MVDEYCHRPGVDLDADREAAAAAKSRIYAVVLLVATGEVYYLTIDLPLLVAVAEDNAAAVGVVFPDAQLLNAPWQKSGRESYGEKADGWYLPFTPSVFFSFVRMVCYECVVVLMQRLPSRLVFLAQYC